MSGQPEGPERGLDAATALAESPETFCGPCVFRNAGGTADSARAEQIADALARHFLVLPGLETHLHLRRLRDVGSA